MILKPTACKRSTLIHVANSRLEYACVFSVSFGNTDALLLLISIGISLLKYLNIEPTRQQTYDECIS